MLKLGRYPLYKILSGHLLIHLVNNRGSFVRFQGSLSRSSLRQVVLYDCRCLVVRVVTFSINQDFKLSRFLNLRML